MLTHSLHAHTIQHNPTQSTASNWATWQREGTAQDGHECQVKAYALLVARSATAVSAFACHASRVFAASASRAASFPLASSSLAAMAPFCSSFHFLFCPWQARHDANNMRAEDQGMYFLVASFASTPAYAKAGVLRDMSVAEQRK